MTPSPGETWRLFASPVNPSTLKWTSTGWRENGSTPAVVERAIVALNPPSLSRSDEGSMYAGVIETVVFGRFGIVASTRKRSDPFARILSDSSILNGTGEIVAGPGVGGARTATLNSDGRNEIFSSSPHSEFLGFSSVMFLICRSQRSVSVFAL